MDMRINRIGVLLLALALLTLCGVAPAESSPEAVTGAELESLLSAVQSQVNGKTPLNDPAGEDARSEDGIRHQFEEAELFADGPVLDGETAVNTLLFRDSEGAVLRSTGIDTQWVDLLSAHPLDNEELYGTREEAVLYLRKTEGDGFRYGRILRDGQRISAAEYGEIYAVENGYRQTSVTYSLTNGLVTSIRVDGLDAGDLLQAEEVQEKYAELETLAAIRDYRAVKTSRNGLELTAFGEEDLHFCGFDFSSLQPSQLPGHPSTELVDNEDGTWLLICSGEGYEAVFQTDAQGENARVLNFSLLDDTLEGPRCVRMGDLFSDDYCRFRNGENEMTDAFTELLYGTEGSAPWGMANYDFANGETTLRYVTGSAAGEVELLLQYEQNLLCGIILHMVN